MAEPSKKSGLMEKYLDFETLRTFGRRRTASIRADICVSCGGEAGEFRDDLSRKEYAISGFCQSCQDKVF